MSKIVAFIPARSGSKRVKNKNIKNLGSHPLIAYTIQAAINSNIFDSVICVTDSEEYAEIARYYGAKTPFIRPKNISGDNSPDIEWVKWSINELKKSNINFDVFSILRPTSPFRTSQTIRKAWDLFNKNPSYDSLRAVEICNQHPGKMWTIRNNCLLPILPYSSNNTPWHSSQFESLPKIYVQNASLEISLTKNVMKNNDISGSKILPFLTEGFEGFDINLQNDWILAELFINESKNILPEINLEPYK